MKVSERQLGLSAQVPQQQVLRFRLQPDLDLETAIEIDRVTELISIPLDRVVPMPHLPPAVMGVYNWRGEILWIVDFSQLLGLEVARARQHSTTLKPAIVLSHLITGGETISLGLVVDKIEEIESCNTELIQQIDSTRTNRMGIEPIWIKGYCRSNTDAELLVLNRQTIFNCTQLQSNI